MPDTLLLLSFNAATLADDAVAYGTRDPGTPLAGTAAHVAAGFLPFATGTCYQATFSGVSRSPLGSVIDAPASGLIEILAVPVADVAAAQAQAEACLRDRYDDRLIVDEVRAFLQPGYVPRPELPGELDCSTYWLSIYQHGGGLVPPSLKGCSGFVTPQMLRQAMLDVVGARRIWGAY